MPPKGICASSWTVGPLTWQMPDWMRRAQASSEDLNSPRLFGIVRVASLMDEDRGRPILPKFLGRSQHPRFVLDHNVVMGGEVPLDLVKFVLLVYVDKDTALNHIKKPRRMNLQRLKHDVPIRNDRDQTSLLEMCDDVERFGEQPLRERIKEQIQRQLEKMLLAGALASVALKSTEIIGVAQFFLQFVKDLPIMLLVACRELQGEVFS